MIDLSSKTQFELQLLHFKISDFISKNLPPEYCIRFIKENFSFYYFTDHHLVMIKGKLKWLHHRLVLSNEEI